MSHRIRHISTPVRCSALLLAIAAGIGAAEADADAAAQPQQGDAITVTGERDPHHNESSSTALFGTTRLIETPFSVGVMNRELIENQRAFTTAEVLRNDAAVSNLGSGSNTTYNRQDFMVRGFALDNFYGYRVDGLTATHMVEPAIDNMERVEVLKGPAGLRFGFMSPGGAVNYVRKRPTEATTASLHLDADSFGRMYTQLDVGGRVNDGAVGYRVVAAGEQIDSFYDNAAGERIFASAFLDWRVNEAVTLWTSIEQQQFNQTTASGTPVSASGRILDHGGPEANYAELWSRNYQEYRTISVGADVALAKDWSLHTANTYSYAVRWGNTSYIGPVLDNGDYDVRSWLFDPQTWTHLSNQTHLEGSFATGPITHDLVVGVSYRSMTNRQGGRNGNLLGTSNVYNPTKFTYTPLPYTQTYDRYFEKETGLFATDTIAFTEAISVLLGARYASIESSTFSPTGAKTAEYDDSAISPTVALMIEPISNVHTYLSYTQGLQTGGTAPPAATNSLEQMSPIESRQIELGVKTELLDGRLSGELAVFQIEQDLEYLNTANTYVQDGLRRHRGVEVAVRGRVAEPVTVGTGFMLLDAAQKKTGTAALDGKQPTNTPTYQANLWADYEVEQVPGLGFNLIAYAVSERYADAYETYEMDSYIILNAGARYRFKAADAQWTARVNIENLTDEVYYVGGVVQPSYGGAYDNGSPLAARFSLQVDF